jgi:uncharacterized protein (DUF2235 family)
MPRNLVICCDGTNNSLASPLTNVAHLNALADIKDVSRQLPYYDAGVGVEANPRRRTRIGAMLSKWSGSAFGTGLVENVEHAYSHLVRNYAEGDRIYLFGFSRGAYTVRVIAGLLHNYGLLRREHAADSHQHREVLSVSLSTRRLGVVNGVPTPAQDERFDQARRIRTVFAQPCPIHFMGLFDTVSSLGWAWEPKLFPNTMTMPNVKILRHALAVDERRAKFRTNRVKCSTMADHKQMWLRGSAFGCRRRLRRSAQPPVANSAALDAGRAARAGMLINDDALRALDLENTWMQDEQDRAERVTHCPVVRARVPPLPNASRTDTGWVKGKRVYRGHRAGARFRRLSMRTSP